MKDRKENFSPSDSIDLKMQNQRMDWNDEKKKNTAEILKQHCIADLPILITMVQHLPIKYVNESGNTS